MANEPASESAADPDVGASRPAFVLRFPTDRPLGTLRVRPWNGRDELPKPVGDPSYELLAEAEGEVQVPAGVAVDLYVNAPYKQVADLATLAWPIWPG